MATSQLLLTTLKKVLRAKNVTYAALAEKLGLSETSVKRMLTQRSPLDLERLDAICAFAGVDLFDLVRLTRADVTEQAHLDLEQEEALAKDVKLFICFYSLLVGLTREAILETYDLSLPELERCILEAERLRLVTSLPSGAVRVLVPRTIEWMEDGPLSRLYEAQMKEEFLAADFDQRLELMKFVTGTLSERSQHIVLRKVRSLLAEIREMSQVDGALDVERGTQTMTLLVAIREWIPSAIGRYRRAPPAPNG